MKVEITCECSRIVEMQLKSWKLWQKRHNSNDYKCHSCLARSSSNPNKKEYDRTLFHQLYMIEKLSYSQMATKLGISQSRVGQIMKQLDLKARTYADASSNMNDQKTITFNHHQHQLILGSMLGDAGLYREFFTSNKKCKSSLNCLRLTFTHSSRHLQYLLHKKDVIGGCNIGERTSGHGSIIKHFSFCHTPSLEPYTKLCHDSNHNKLVTEKWLNEVGWEGIAYWYMDDGSLMYNTKTDSYRLRFYTNSFNESEISLLQDFLSSKGLKTVTTRGNKKNEQLIICSKTSESELIIFLKKLKPYIIPSMRYKIRILDNVRCPAREYHAPQNTPRQISPRTL